MRVAYYILASILVSGSAHALGADNIVAMGNLLIVQDEVTVQAFDLSTLEVADHECSADDIQTAIMHLRHPALRLHQVLVRRQEGSWPSDQALVDLLGRVATWVRSQSPERGPCRAPTRAEAMSWVLALSYRMPAALGYVVRSDLKGVAEGFRFLKERCGCQP